MTKELKPVVGLLKGSDPELRCAAARVLAALDADDDETIGALARAAGDDNGMVRTYAVDALRKLAKPKHVDVLLPLLEGPSREKVLPLVKELGGNPMSALKKGLDDPGKRLASAQSIASLGGRAAFEALLKETADADIEYVKNITNLLRGVIDGLKDEEREKGFESAKKLLEGSKERIQRVAAIRVLGYLHLPEAADLLTKLTAVTEHPSIRSHAIHAIALLNFGQKKPAASLIKTLVGLLDDKDPQNIIEPALQTLAKLPLPETLDLDPLLEHPIPAVKVLAIRQLTARGDRASGQKLIELMEDRDEEVRDAAAHALRREPKFAAMLAGFMEKEGKEGKEGRVDLFASILKGYREGLPKAEVAKFLDRGLEMFAKDGQQNWALDVAKSASPEQYKEALFAGAMKQKKAKRLDLAERLLSQLLRDGGGTDEGTRFELAVVRLALGPKPEDAAARNSSYALAMLKDLVKGDAKGMLKKLKSDPVLGGAEFLFAGRYFLAHAGFEGLGEDLLKVTMKEGNAKEAAAAKAALKERAGKG